VDVGFSYVPRNMTLARMIRQQKVADVPTFAKSGLREMTDADIPEVLELFTRYMKRFDMSPIMTKEEATHQFLSGRGKGDASGGWGGKREGQVVWSYVVEVMGFNSDNE
jgi:glycylpeptide N-tetradecanoyltransferase